jgi:phosphatidylserine synthase
MPLLASIMRNPLLVAGVLIMVGGLMVSTLPTWSFKNFKVPRAAVLPLLPLELPAHPSPRMRRQLRPAA